MTTMTKSSALLTAENIAKGAFKALKIYGFSKAQHVAVSIDSCYQLDKLDGQPLEPYSKGTIKQAITFFQIYKKIAEQKRSTYTLLNT